MPVSILHLTAHMTSCIRDPSPKGRETSCRHQRPSAAVAMHADLVMASAAQESLHRMLPLAWRCSLRPPLAMQPTILRSHSLMKVRLRA